MPNTAAPSGTPQLYALVNQHDNDNDDDFELNDETQSLTSSGPQHASNTTNLLSRSTAITLSLCLLCSLLTLVATSYVTLTNHEQIVDWLNGDTPSSIRPPSQSPFSVQSATQSLFKDTPIATLFPSLVSPTTDSPTASDIRYHAVSTTEPLHPLHPPTHVSTLFNASASSLPVYIADTHIDHTQTRQAYQLLDQALAGAQLWPGRVDLMVRTTTFSATILPLMFQSIELFWPRNIGRCIVVADELPKDRWQVPLSMPDWCELHYEYVLPEMANRGRWAMQWHDFWGDNYTSADYVAVADTDSYFTYKITPDILFDPQGRVRMSIDKDFQRGLYDFDTKWWVGDNVSAVAAATPNMAHLLRYYPINFMQNLPVVMPTELYPAFRQYIVSKHGNANLTFFDAINKDFLEHHMRDPSQFCILGNYWQYFSPPALRNRLHIVLTDHSTLDIDRQQLGLPSTNGTDALEKTYQIFMKATVHVPHSSYYRGSPSVPKKHPDDKIDPPSLYDFTQKLQHIGLCQSKKHWHHIDSSIRAMSCSIHTADDLALHMDMSMLYAYHESGWHMNMHRRDLSIPHAYEAKWGWMGDIVNAAYEGGLQAAIDVAKRFPTHVEWDREQTRLQLQAAERIAQLKKEFEQKQLERQLSNSSSAPTQSQPAQQQ